MRETRSCVLLHVTSRRSRDPYCCAIQRLQRRLETLGAERSEGRGNVAKGVESIAHYCYAIAFQVPAFQQFPHGATTPQYI
jgi:hypothetical protein